MELPNQEQPDQNRRLERELSLATDRIEVIGKELAQMRLKPTLIKMSAIQEFSALEPDNGIAKPAPEDIKPSPWVVVDASGPRTNHHYPGGGISGDIVKDIATIADIVKDNQRSIAAIKDDIGTRRTLDTLFAGQQKSVWAIAQSNFALATWLSRVADRNTALDTLKIVQDSEIVIRNTNKTLKKRVREGGDSFAFGPLALPVPVRAADVMTTLVSLNDDTLLECVNDRENSWFVEFGRNQAKPIRNTPEQRKAIKKAFAAANRQVRDLLDKNMRAYVFFAGAASNDGPVSWNELLSEKRADWAQRTWTAQFLEQVGAGAKNPAGLNVETVAFGQGERISKAGISTARSVEIFVCPHHVEDPKQPIDETETIAKK